jgi:putative phosphoesterase
MPLRYELENRCLIAIMSDTHGHLSAAVCNIVKKTDLIIHAGDIGGADILRDLKKIASVVAVRGNMDGGRWARDLPASEIVQVAGFWMYVIHDAYLLELEPAAANISVVISGHTHQPALRQENGVLYINPGSASQPRYGNPATIAILQIDGNVLLPRIIDVRK